MNMMQAPDESTQSILEVFSELGPKGYCVVVNLDRQDVDYMQMNYPIPWLEHYAKHSLLVEDPTVTFAREGNYTNAPHGHTTWDELRGQFPDSRTLTECRQFGIDQGNTVVIQVDGIKSLLSCAGHNWTDAEVRRARRALFELHELKAKPHP